MMMNAAKVFQNGDSQAVRLPKEFRFKTKEVLIRKEGDNVILMPLHDVTDRFWNTLGKFSKDLKIKRNQPKKYQTRESL